MRQSFLRGRSPNKLHPAREELFEKKTAQKGQQSVYPRPLSSRTWFVFDPVTEEALMVLFSDSGLGPR